jgi:hypothetical protein
LIHRKSVPRAIKKAFKHKILLAPEGYLPPLGKIRKRASIVWKERALNAMRRRFYFQVLKSNVKLKQRWWNNYCIKRIGVPDAREFLCRETFYVAEMSNKLDAQKFRNYWYWCRRRSFEILEWLWKLDANDYCWSLHVYLKGLIVTKRPILSEIERYDAKSSEEIALQIFGKWKDTIHGISDKKEAASLR